MQVDDDTFGVEYNPETLLFHQESVEVPETLEMDHNQREQIQDTLQKDSNNFGIDIYEEIIEIMFGNQV